MDCNNTRTHIPPIYTIYPCHQRKQLLVFVVDVNADDEDVIEISGKYKV
jgi:hypothetical protein